MLSSPLPRSPLPMADEALSSRERRYRELEARAGAARAKQRAGQQLAEEEEAVLRDEAALGAELRAKRERQKRKASRAGGLAVISRRRRHSALGPSPSRIASMETRRVGRAAQCAVHVPLSPASPPRPACRF